jgi:hypothetical protein
VHTLGGEPLRKNYAGWIFIRPNYFIEPKPKADLYRYLLGDLLTNEIVAELPLTSVAFTQQLNQAGTFTAHLLLSGINPRHLM